MANNEFSLLEIIKHIHPTPSIFPAVLLFIVVLCAAIPTAASTDTLLPGQSISINKTLTSKSGVFELGSFTSTFYEQPYLGVRYKRLSERSPVFRIGELGSFTSTFYEQPYLGVRYKRLSERSPVFRIGANYFPITSSANVTLHFLRYRLYIEEPDSEVVLWSSNSTTNGSAASVAILLDTGNFVVRDETNTSVTIWQSFNYPSDVLLPGAWLRSGLDPVGLHIYDPPFSCTLNEIARGTFSIDTEYDQYFRGGSSYVGEFPDWMFTYEEDGNSASYLSFPENQNDIEFLKLKVGLVSFLRWLGNATTGAWQTLWSSPSGCEVSPLICGAFGACIQGKCKCIDGFEPTLPDEWERGRFVNGCSSIHPLKCENGITTDSFVLLDDWYELPNYYNLYNPPVTSIEACRSACLRNCNCSAYFYDWYSSRCAISTYKLYGSKLVAYCPHCDTTIYVRVGSADKKGMNTQEIVALVVGSVAIIVTVSLLLLIYKRSASRQIQVEGFLTRYSYTQLKKATRNFSEKLGEGGFGSVFKGVIAGPTLVAVKKLKGLGYGDKQFRTEVQTIGMIQQMNLVRLLGFCAEGTRRLLVYEYMANGSLDAHLFSDSSSALSWNLRYRIAVGIAKGLAYLHEECNNCIIHCDIKPENILLDAEFCPKIADFGMAKLLKREYSTALTTFRGTIGYLAPEWLSGQAVTHKVDVYSFGMVLFEIISGRRTATKMRFGNHIYFPSYAATQVKEGEVLCLLDGRLGGNANVKELEVACRVACWCIQDDENHRASMGQVVRMLEGVVYPEVPPIPASFQYLMGYDDSSIYSAEGPAYFKE